MSASRRLFASTSPVTLGLVATAGAGILAFNMSGGMKRDCPSSKFQPPHFQPSQPQKSLGSKPVFPGSGFIELTLEESHLVNYNTKELRFKLPSGADVSGLGAVSSLLTKHTSPGAWIPTFRPYTPISTSDSSHVTLLVKQYPNGRASTHLHNLQPGQTLSAKSLPEYDYKLNTCKQMILVAGGAGITPMYQLLQTVLRNPADKTQLRLVYANATDDDILLKQELDTLAQTHADRFKATYVLTDPAITGTGIEKGYVTKEILAKQIAGQRLEDIKVLVCGPPAMTTAIAGAKAARGWAQGSVGGFLKELGLSKEQVHKF